MNKALDSLHTKILNSKFAEEVTQEEIEALIEAKNNGWISVDDRLPEEKGLYMVTQEIYSLDGKRLLRTVISDVLFNSVNQKWDISDNLKVIAWQPLPPVWKGVEDGKK